MVRAALGDFPELANAVVIVGQSQGGHAALSAALPKPTLRHQYQEHCRNQRARPAVVRAPRAPGLHTVLSCSTGAWLTIGISSFGLSERIRPASVRSPGKTCRSLGPQPSRQRPCSEMPEALIASAVDAYPTLRFNHPVLIGAGLDDKSVLAEEQYKIALDACRTGSMIETHYYSGEDHGGTMSASLVDSVPFVKKTLAGEPVTGNCASIGPPTRK